MGSIIVCCEAYLAVTCLIFQAHNGINFSMFLEERGFLLNICLEINLSDNYLQQNSP